MSYFDNFLTANQAYVALHGDLHLPSGLFHLQQGNHGRTCQCEMEYFLRLSRCDCLNYIKFQFDRDNFYQIKKPALKRCWFFCSFLHLVPPFPKNFLTIFLGGN